MSSSLRTIGLTGGIAAGKSSVARLFAEAGWPVVDADLLAREVVAPGQPALARIVELFGRDVLDADGGLDRKALGQRVFADGVLRAALEAILHPAIAELSQRRFAELAAAGHLHVVYEAALLVETGRHADFDVLVVVIADDETRIGRMGARDGLNEAEARRRLAAQLPQARKAALADYVIDNSGTLQETRAAVAAVRRSILAAEKSGAE